MYFCYMIWGYTVANILVPLYQILVVCVCDCIVVENVYGWVFLTVNKIIWTFSMCTYHFHPVSCLDVKVTNSYCWKVSKIMWSGYPQTNNFQVTKVNYSLLCGHVIDGM